MESTNQPIHVSKLYHIMNSNAAVTWLDIHGEYNGYVPNCDTVKNESFSSNNNIKLPRDIGIDFIKWLSEISNIDYKIVDAESCFDKTGTACTTSELIIINPCIQNNEIVSTPAILIHCSVLQNVFQKMGYLQNIPFCNYVAIDFSSDSIKEKKNLTPLLNGKDVRHFKTTFESLQRIIDIKNVNEIQNNNLLSYIGGLLIDKNWSSKNSAAFRYYLYNRNTVCSYKNAFELYNYIVKHPTPFISDKLELCPNMSIQNVKWSDSIQKLSFDSNEITLIYKCSSKLREEAWKLGVKTYYDLLKISKHIKIPPISLKIIWANHKDNKYPIISPRKLTQSNHLTLLTMIKKSPWFTCDFETVIDDGKLWIFMITTSISIGNTLIEIHTDSMQFLTVSEQIRVLNDWIQWMKGGLSNISKDLLFENVPVFHWSTAEKTFLTKCLNQNPTTSELYNDLSNILWSDACEIFKKEEIVIPGAFDYKLKHIAGALLKHKKIKCSWDDDVQNGFVAMQLALENYNSKKRRRSDTKNFLKRIQKYNENDVLVLEDIVCFLQTMI